MTHCIPQGCQPWRYVGGILGVVENKGTPKAPMITSTFLGLLIVIFRLGGNGRLEHIWVA
jgi:hypothetical protein